MRVFRLIAFGWLLGIALCDFASAQSLAGCRGINQTDGLKVVLDKLELKSEAGTTQILTSEYEFEFLLELRSRLKNLFPDTQPKPVLCANRAPNPDGSDFVPGLVKTLNNRDVLVEIWGTVKASTENGEQALKANIFMMIIPVRHYEGSSAQLDFHLLSYPKKNVQGDFETAIVKMVLGAEFDVYTSIAHGIKALKNDSYNDAKMYLSNARIQWEKALEKGSLSNSAIDQNLVLAYIRNLEQKTIAEAAADSNYSGDLMAIMDVLVERGP